MRISILDFGSQFSNKIMEMINHSRKILKSAERNGLFFGQPAKIGMLVGENGVLFSVGDLGQPVNHHLVTPLDLVVQCFGQVFVDF